MILIFDASIEGFAVGLFHHDGRLISESINDIPYSHTELLVPSIQRLLNQSNLRFDQLTKIITTKGPGSFTGIRVGLATAAGLEAALGIQTITVNTLTALAHSFIKSSPTPSLLHCVLDTKCGEVYHQSYCYDGQSITPNTEPASISLDALKKIAYTGSIVTHPTSVGILQDIPYETTLVRLSGVWRAARNLDASNLQPLYVRSANITQSKKHA